MRSSMWIALSVVVAGLVACGAAPVVRGEIFKERASAPHALTAFVVGQGNDCASAMRAADFLRWPSMRSKISIGSVLLVNASKAEIRAAASEAAELHTVTRAPSAQELQVLHRARLTRGRHIILVDPQGRIAVAVSLSDDVRHKRSIRDSILTLTSLTSELSKQ